MELLSVCCVGIHEYEAVFLVDMEELTIKFECLDDDIYFQPSVLDEDEMIELLNKHRRQ